MKNVLASVAVCLTLASPAAHAGILDGITGWLSHSAGSVGNRFAHEAAGVGMMVGGGLGSIVGGVVAGVGGGLAYGTGWAVDHVASLFGGHTTFANSWGGFVGGLGFKVAVASAATALYGGLVFGSALHNHDTANPFLIAAVVGDLQKNLQAALSGNGEDKTAVNRVLADLGFLRSQISLAFQSASDVAGQNINDPLNQLPQLPSSVPGSNPPRTGPTTSPSGSGSGGSQPPVSTPGAPAPGGRGAPGTGVGVTR